MRGGHFTDDANPVPPMSQEQLGESMSIPPGAVGFVANEMRTAQKMELHYRSELEDEDIMEDLSEPK
eukprot:1561985-Rhodomonas_salina.1